MNNKSLRIHDVIIIGAGPIGLACAIEAQKRGLNYLVLEKGCIVNSVYNYPTNMTFFSTSEKIEIGGVPFVSHGMKPTRKEALEYYRRVSEAYGLNISVYERVHMIEKAGGVFKVFSEKRTYVCRSLVIATGYYDNPNLLGVPGEDLPKVKHYFDEGHSYSGLDTAVIGAGNSAVDVALELFRVGARVTMIIREEAVKPSVKYWVKPDIENRIMEGSIKACFNTTVAEIRNNDIVTVTPSGKKTLKNDFVFAMTGYHPDFAFLKESGVRIQGGKKAIFRKTNNETNTEGIYLAGVVCSGDNTDKYFIENSIVHSKIIMDDIAKKLRKIRK